MSPRRTGPGQGNSQARLYGADPILLSAVVQSASKKRQPNWVGSPWRCHLWVSLPGLTLADRRPSSALFTTVLAGHTHSGVWHADDTRACRRTTSAVATWPPHLFDPHLAGVVNVERGVERIHPAGHARAGMPAHKLQHTLLSQWHSAGYDTTRYGLRAAPSYLEETESRRARGTNTWSFRRTCCPAPQHYLGRLYVPYLRPCSCGYTDCTRK